MREKEKQAASHEAASLVKEGMIVGLGTGSTAAYMIKELGRRVAAGLHILGVPTSYQAQYLALECGIPLTTLDEHPRIDIAIDGADQVAGLNALKGGGGAHTREKIVARSAEKFVVIIDENKVVHRLDRPVPLEVLPYARRLVEREVEELGGKPVLRLSEKKAGPVITDNGNLLIDADFGPISDPEALDIALSRCEGIIEHGIFTGIDTICIGKKDGRVETIS